MPGISCHIICSYAPLFYRHSYVHPRVFKEAAAQLAMCVPLNCRSLNEKWLPTRRLEKGKSNFEEYWTDEIQKRNPVDVLNVNFKRSITQLMFLTRDF